MEVKVAHGQLKHVTCPIFCNKPTNDRSKFRCYNSNKIRHLTTECRKQKQVKKDKDYLELEAKYEALPWKQQSKVYITVGKCWGDIDEDEPKEFGNLALMAKSIEPSSSSQVATLTTAEMFNSQFKKLLKN